jgi:hypothetical protein
MSDDGAMATGAPNETRNAAPKQLRGASDESLASGSRSSLDQIDPLATFVEQRPFTSALFALVVGYLLGKIT